MTDPDASSFRAGQSAHAQELKAVHILTKTLGCTRSQARQAVRLTAAQRAVQVQPNANEGSHATPLFQPGPQRSETKVEPLPATPRPIPAEPLLVPPGGGVGAGLTLTNCVVVVDGVLYTADIYLDPDSLTIVT